MEVPEAKCLNNIVGNHLQAGETQTKIPLSNGAMNRKALRSPNRSNANLVIHFIHMEMKNQLSFSFHILCKLIQKRNLIMQSSKTQGQQPRPSNLVRIRYNSKVTMTTTGL